MTRWAPGLPHYEHPNHELLLGLGAIADYLRVSVVVIKNLIYHEDLPVMQLPNGNWFTSKKCLVAWAMLRDNHDLQRLRSARARVLAEDSNSVEKEASEILVLSSRRSAA